jgi:hypothetical protein
MAFGSSRGFGIFAAVVLLAGCGGTQPPFGPVSQRVGINGQRIAHFGSRHLSAADFGFFAKPGRLKANCPGDRPGFFYCQSFIQTDVPGMRVIGDYAYPNGISPENLWEVYDLPGIEPYPGPTVAIVDAFDDPNIESDLGYYRAWWGLPSCTTVNGCFTKIKIGSPAGNQGWGGEESLDTEMVSAVCPTCKIVLIEATNQSNTNLLAAEALASASYKYISNSWSVHESEQLHECCDSYFEQPGILYTAASGDNGHVAKSWWPPVIPNVVAVGETQITSLSPRMESAYPGSASSCSTIYPRPAFQEAIWSPPCTMRANVDVSAVGTGVSIYDTYGSGFSYEGWSDATGASVSTPIIAALFAEAASTGGNPQLYPNEHDLFDITSGSDAGTSTTCGWPMCIAGTGWDGPSGLGAPEGLAAFSP